MLRAVVLIVVAVAIFYVFIVIIALTLFNMAITLIFLLFFCKYLKWACQSILSIRRDINLKQIKRFL